MDFFKKEKMFLSKMSEIFDFYDQNPPTDYRVIGALQTMGHFLKSDVERWSVAEKLHLHISDFTSYAVMGYHNCLMGD